MIYNIINKLLVIFTWGKWFYGSRSNFFKNFEISSQKTYYLRYVRFDNREFESVFLNGAVNHDIKIFHTSFLDERGKKKYGIHIYNYTSVSNSVSGGVIPGSYFAGTKNQYGDFVIMTPVFYKEFNSKADGDTFFKKHFKTTDSKYVSGENNDITWLTNEQLLNDIKNENIFTSLNKYLHFTWDHAITNEIFEQMKFIFEVKNQNWIPFSLNNWFISSLYYKSYESIINDIFKNRIDSALSNLQKRYILLDRLYKEDGTLDKHKLILKRELNDINNFAMKYYKTDNIMLIKTTFSSLHEKAISNNKTIALWNDAKTPFSEFGFPPLIPTPPPQPPILKPNKPLPLYKKKPYDDVDD